MPAREFDSPEPFPRGWQCASTCPGEIEHHLTGLDAALLRGEELVVFGGAPFDDRDEHLGFGWEVVEERARAMPLAHAAIEADLQVVWFTLER
ncbi:hypothetical protein [Sciscionella marina]|uniref:hypothetical protein n=1 Tax=Sciscionella marina TaxID=508770 RepID=UPI001F0946D3|nr:hypothetical protein [Sciscionella marina]